MKYKYKYITSIATIGIVLFISIMSIVTPDREVSDLEGRTLQKLPNAYNIYENNDVISNLKLVYHSFTGQLFKWWDNYFSDQIYNRDIIVSAFTEIQGNMNKKYINGTFIGENNYVFSPTQVMGVQDSTYIQSANHFNSFADRFNKSKTYIVNLPRKEMIYGENMPIDNYKSGVSVGIDKVIDNIDKDKIDILDFRSIINKDDNLFYKTDHHWNMNGTYKAYEYIINGLNNYFKEVGSPKSKDEYDIKIYENYFVGTDGRKVGTLIEESEDIEVYYNDDFKNYNVYNQDGKFDLLHEEFLDEEKFNNDYMVYLGGDNPEIKIENTQSSNDLKIVMIGDSMDNPLIPLMASHFNELYSYDLRHYKEDIIKQIDSIKPDIIMLIGLSNNFINGENSEIFKWNIE